MGPKRVDRLGLDSGLGAVSASALLESVAVAVHLENVGMMGKAIEQSAGESFRAEDLGPLLEGQVRGHHR